MGFGFFYFDYRFFLFMLPAVILTAVAQFKVQSTFHKYSQVRSQRGYTGAQAADAVARHGGALNVGIRAIGGSLSDNFDPRNNTISLSQPVYGSSSVSAIGVAAHEAGHSIQHAQGYVPNKIRSALVPVTQFGSNLAMPLILVGLLLPVQYSTVVYIGIALYGLAVLFQLVTLPVEFNASARALRVLGQTEILTEEELRGARKVLSAAAMTYVAASFVALLQLLRLVLIAMSRGGGNRSNQ